MNNIEYYKEYGMLALFTTPPVLTPGWTHDATDWQVAEDEDFKNIVLKSMGDTENKLVKIFDDSKLDPQKTYYARSRIVFNKGLAEWSNVEIVKLKEKDIIDITTDIPTLVAIPEIDVNFDSNNMPPILFTINTSNFSCTSNAKHKTTSYIIEDIEGNVVFANIDDEQQLTSKLISEILLVEGKAYNIKVAHRATSEDMSPFTTMIVYIPGVKDIKVLTDLSNVTLDNDVVVKLDPVDHVKNIHVELLAAGENTVEKLYTDDVDTFTFSIPKNSFNKSYKMYLLSLQYTYDNDSKSLVKYVPVIISENA
jgi:hypothetical protein